MSATTPAPAAPEPTWSDRDTAAAIPDEVREAVDAVLVDSDLARPEREILTTRIERWYPDVADGLTTLYGEPVATRTAANLLAEAARAPHRPRVVVGFAAETGTDEEVAAFGRAKARRKGADLMAVNRVGQGEGFGDVPNRIEVLDADGRSVGAASGTKDDVAEYLVGLIASRLATLSA